MIHISVTNHKLLFIILYHLCLTNFLVLAEEVTRKEESIDYTICAPISDIPGSLSAAVKARLIGESEIELAIFANGQTAFHSVILTKKEDIFLCDYRVIKFKDVTSDIGLDKNLVVGAEVHISSKPIDKKMVEILKEVLKKQIQMATYKADKNFKWNNILDATAYDIYVKGDKNDVFPVYSARFFDPLFQGSYRCDYIYLALNIFSTSENESFRKIPLTNLTNYLIDKKNGVLDAIDPSIKDSTTDIDMDAPDR